LEWVFHVPPLRNVEVSFKIRALEPLRIGAGKDTEGITDLPIVRMLWKGGQEVPVIPGSSLKGVLRTVGESLWSSVIGKYVHEDSGGNPVCKGASDLMKEIKNWKIPIDEARRRVARGLCPVCLTYGVPGFMSKVLVGDFFPAYYSVGVIKQASIHRKKGTATNPREVEYVEPGSLFEGELTLNNAPNWMIALVLASLYLIDSGFVKLGGFKSRGFGAVKIEDLEVKAKDLKPLDEYDKELDADKLSDLGYAYRMWTSMAKELKNRYGDRR